MDVYLLYTATAVYNNNTPSYYWPAVSYDILCNYHINVIVHDDKTIRNHGAHRPYNNII